MKEAIKKSYLDNRKRRNKEKYQIYKAAFAKIEVKKISQFELDGE